MATLPKSKLQPTPLSLVFSRTFGSGWREQLMVYVEAAAREGDEGMQSVLALYKKMKRKERIAFVPEVVCDLAGIKPSDMIAEVQRVLWEYGRMEAGLIVGASHPKVIGALAKSAVKPKNISDREMWLKGTGFLPPPKGTSISVVGPTMQVANMPSGTPVGTLPAMEDDILEIEAESEKRKLLPAVKEFHVDVPLAAGEGSVSGNV
jgi:hypothetical protein